MRNTYKYLKEYEPETFDLLRLDLLSNSFKRPKYERNEILHLFKQIRNRFNNPNQIKKKGYNKPTDKNQLGFNF